jgi:hypothetical protein
VNKGQSSNPVPEATEHGAGCDSEIPTRVAACKVPSLAHTHQCSPWLWGACESSSCTGAGARRGMVRIGSRISVREAARLFQLLAHLAQLATLAVGASQVVHRLGRHAHARTRRTRVGSGAHNITETKNAYEPSLSPERFLAENQFGKMIADPMTADPASRQHRKFVSEFRVPFAVYTQILKDCRGSAWSGSTAGRGGVGGRPGLALEAKVLSALYRLGTGCVARTPGSLFGMIPSTAQCFFLDFCAHLSQRYQDECSVPGTDDEMKHIENVYARMGFPGCLGSVDGVHIH